MPTDVAISVEVSPGELIDKITILEIKRERIGDEKKLARVRKELDLLVATRDRAILATSELRRLTDDLREVNARLWDIEDDIRVCERTGDFGPRFIELARAVYKNNDRRAELKYEINWRLNSSLFEVKSYAAA